MLKDHIKKLGSDSCIYGLGGIVNRLLSFFLVPLFTRYLQPQDYGIMSMIALLSIALGGVFTLGTGNSMGIYYFGTEMRKERDRIIWTTALLLLANITLLTCILISFSPYLSLLLLKSKEYSLLVTLSLAGFALQNIAMPFMSYLRMERKPWHFFWVTLFSSVLTICLNVVTVVGLGRGIRGMLEVNIIVGALSLLLLVVIIARQVHFDINLSWIPKLVRTGFPSIFGVGAFFVVDYVDRAFIQHFCGMGELGIYSIGYNFGMIMILFAEGSFGTAWPAYFISFINKRDEAVQVFGRIFKYALFSYGILTLMFFIAARPIVALMTTTTFHAAWTVVGMVAAAYVMKVLYLIMLPPLYFEKKLHIQTTIEWTAAAINVGLNFLLIPVLKKEGAALATLVSYITLPVFTYWAGQKLMYVKYEWRCLATFSVSVAVLAGITLIDITGSIWGDMSLNILIFIVFIVVVYKVFITVKEKADLKDLLSKYGVAKERQCSGTA